MEMEMEVKDELALALDRLNAAAAQLEQAAERVSGVDLQASLDRLSHASARESELTQRLAEAEATVASLKADAGKSARRIAPGMVAGGVPSLLAKHVAEAEPGALDAALRSLSPEQRIAVKSELMRAGLIG